MYPARYAILIMAILLLMVPAPAAGAKPVVGFTANVTTGDTPLAVRFADLSAGATGRVWFFGDETYRNPWYLKNASPGWSSRESFGNTVLPDGSIIISGGWPLTNDTWRSADKGVTWTQMTAAAAWSARYGHSMVTLPDGSILLTGGADSGRINNETWRSTNKGITWVMRNASSGWSPRLLHSGVVLSDGSVLVMGGFLGGGQNANDVWRSADLGRTWTRVNGSAGWAVRYSQAGTVLPDGRVLVMGGNSASAGLMNDVWASSDNGTTWSRMTAAAPWVKRYGLGSVAMPDGSVLIAGGFVGVGAAASDLWRSQDGGATWVRVNASTGWTGRSSHAIVAIPDGSVLVMGGSNDSFRHDIWSMNPAGSQIKNPVHSYSQPKKYSVTLQAFSATGVNSTKKTGYITATAGSPVVTSIVPAAGKRGNLIVVTAVLGKNYAAGANVSLNRTGYPLIRATNVSVVNPTKITCTFALPANAPLGLRNVDVKNKDGKLGTKLNAFLVKAPAAPTVTGIQPATGKRGRLVTITNLSGTGFVGTPKPKVQFIKGASILNATNITVGSGRKITCTVKIPAGATIGAWNVRVTNGDNQVGSKASLFAITP